MAKTKSAGLAPVARPVKKVEYKAQLNIPKGSPDRHVVRMGNRTWLVVQPGSSVFVGQFSSKLDAVKMAERHLDVTKGKLTVHA